MTIKDLCPWRWIRSGKTQKEERVTSLGKEKRRATTLLAKRAGNRTRESAGTRVAPQPRELGKEEHRKAREPDKPKARRPNARSAARTQREGQLWD